MDSIRKPHHWMYYTRIYKIWGNIKSRCNNPKTQQYMYYWWRWIKCLWNSFEEFYKDMWPMYKSWLTIDRINWNWNYCKENCRRATMKEQSNNTKRNHIVVYNSKKQNITQWANELWIKRSTLYNRIYRWWDIKKAFTYLDNNRWI